MFFFALARSHDRSRQQQRSMMY